MDLFGVRLPRKLSHAQKHHGWRGFHSTMCRGGWVSLCLPKDSVAPPISGPPSSPTPSILAQGQERGCQSLRTGMRKEAGGIEAQRYIGSCWKAAVGGRVRLPRRGGREGFHPPDQGRDSPVGQGGAHLEGLSFHPRTSQLRLFSWEPFGDRHPMNHSVSPLKNFGLKSKQYKYC